MKTFLISSLCLFLALGACRKSDGDCMVSDREIEELTAAQDAVTAKSITYAEQNTPETCRDFRDAYFQYLEIARTRVDCWIPSQRDALEASIADAEEALHELDCQ